MGTWDKAEAEREFLRALELNPRYVEVRGWHAWFFLVLSEGRVTESVAQAKRALESDPALVNDFHQARAKRIWLPRRIAKQRSILLSANREPLRVYRKRGTLSEKTVLARHRTLVVGSPLRPVPTS